MSNLGTIHILGAGPAGISLGKYALANGAERVVVYEQSDKVGGLARSWQHHGFTLDTGPHIFHTDDKEVKKDWNNIGERIFTEGNFFAGNIHHKYPDKIFDYPVSKETLSKNLSTEYSRELIKEYEKIQSNKPSSNASSFSDYVNKNLGEGLANLFFKDYPEKLWGMKTSAMLAEWAPQRLTVRNNIQPFYTKDFVAVATNGSGSIFEKLTERLTKDGRFELRLNSKVIDLEIKQNKISKIYTEDAIQEVEEEDLVVSTIPATILARILGKPINLSFRGVRSIYMFFKNRRILPGNYNWVYVTDPELPFNRITEPTSMSKDLAPEGHSYICVETTYASPQKILTSESDFEKIRSWMDTTGAFNTEGYIKEFNTCNFEDFVYPIQDQTYRNELSNYNSDIAAIKNLHVLGTGGEFHYSDIQIIFRKSKELADSLLGRKNETKTRSLVPHISTLEMQDNQPDPKAVKTDNLFAKKIKTTLHNLTGAAIPIIAEIGINHNGDIELAKEMIGAAKEAGAHLAKFQFYSNQSRVESNAHTEFMHETADGSELSLMEIFERSSLSNDDCKELINYGKEIDFPIFFTAFDIEAVSQLKSLGQNIVKTASMDLNNIQLHRCIAKHKFETVIISTGMSDINEIHRTLSLYPKDTELLIMSCRSAYPTSFYDVDFGEIQYLRQETQRPVGFSDHTQDLYASITSTLCGASFIERHFTTNQSLVGPDNAISLDSSQIKILTKMLDSIEKTLQYKRKIIHPVEQQTFAIQKKSLRFPHDMQKGERIHTDNLIAIAPPEGFSRFHIDLTPGFYTIQQNVQKNEPISPFNMKKIDD